MIDFIVEMLIKPFFQEKIRVFKYYDQKHAAGRLLAGPNPTRMKRGLSLLIELAVSYPSRAQEIINEITAFLRQTFSKEKPANPQFVGVLELGIRSLTSIPRLDPNGYPYDFDIHQIKIQGMNLTRANFAFFSLWGCQFVDVLLPHSSFQEADLGGAVFEKCSLEYADFKGAKLCGSFMDKGRPTSFRNTRLWAANLDQADIEFCELQNFDRFPLDNLKQKINDGKLKILQPTCEPTQAEPSHLQHAA